LVFQLISSALTITFIGASGARGTSIPARIYAEAERYGIDPDLALAVATVESSLNPKAIGKLGERGLYQLHVKYFPQATFNIDQNIRIGVSYLAEVKRKCADYPAKAWVLCFNHGAHKRLKKPLQARYYVKVMRELNKLRVRRYLALN
jgi:soluble lytic murein transglycosylase-like protein